MTKIKQVIRFVCGICKKEFKTEQEALKCQSSEIHETTEEIRKRRQKKEEKWKVKGHDVWYEMSGMKHAPKVDITKFGAHKYIDCDGTSDCEYGCGCWMGPFRSGGKVNPYGACPNNPKKQDKNNELPKKR